MSDKILEVKIRSLPSQERQDQKDVSRVFLAKEALLDLKLEAGQVCSLWRIDDEEPVRKQAIAWPSGQKLNRNVVQMFKTFQEACGFKLEDRIAVGGVGALPVADAIILKDATDTEGVTSLEEDDLTHWEWFMSENLSRADCIFPGMTFKISLRGPRRVMQVHSVIGPTSGQLVGIGKFAETTRVKIMSNTTSEDQTEETVDSKPQILQVTGIPGLDQPLGKLNKFLARLSSDRKITGVLGGRRSTAILLNGGHGTGKSFILRKLSNSGWGRIAKIDRETKMSSLQQIFRDAKLSKRSIIMIDDLDILVSREQGRAGFDYAISEELDQLYENTVNPKVLVIATASNLADVPQHLKKRGRFETSIALPVPDVNARKDILKFFAKGPAAAPNPHYTDEWDGLLDKLGEKTHAYTGEDLDLLWVEICETAEERLEAEETKGLSSGGLPQLLTQVDIDHALLAVRPSAMHDVTLQPPKVRWDDIGGQKAMKKALRRAIEEPLLHPERLLRLGSSPKKGLLLYGPPGCSKTLSAAACATELSHNFFAVKGPELLNMYVGESERAVRAIFARARAAAPAIIFFDEIESIAGARSGTGGTKSGGNGGVNVLTTLLNELDGIESLNGVIVLAATNAPQALDLALLRPGRFDELLYVAPPAYEDRLDILRLRTRKMDVHPNVVLEEVAAATDGFSGAEVVAVCSKAIDFAMERCEETGLEEQVEMQDFQRASIGPEAVKSRITKSLVRGYERWAEAVKGNGPVGKTTNGSVGQKNTKDGEDVGDDGDWVDEP